MKKSILGFLATAVLSSMASASPARTWVIYGDDNRADIYTIANASIRDVADSTVAMIPVNSLHNNGNGQVEISTSVYGQDSDLCQEEPYYNQPTAAVCSGSLIGDDLVLTAGHCIDDYECSGNSFVFGFRMQNETTANTTLPESEVYNCKKVVAREQTTAQDYAIVQLDRPVSGHRVLTMSSQAANVGDDVYVIGHPMGLPTKVAGGANVRKQNPGFFVANLDTYGGNSGSAVLSAATNQIVGVLVRGDRDLTYVNSKACYISNRCANDGCRGEDVTNISFVQKALNQ